MADQPWIKVPTVALDTFRELDKFRAYCELMSEADVLTRIVEVTVEGLARKYDWSWHKAKRFLSTLVSSGLGAVSSLNGEQTATPTATLQVDFSRLYEASRRPQRQRDGDPESPESDLHNMEHAPARGSILKELKNKKQIPPTPQGAVIEIPIWIDSATWSEWVQFRKEKKQPLKPTTVRRQIQKLTTLRDSGQDPNAIIVQSITNGWTGLFPVNQNGSGGYDYIGVSERVARLARAAESQATTTSGDEGPDGPSEHVQVRPEE